MVWYVFFKVDDAGSRNVIAYMTWECSVKYSTKFSYFFQIWLNFRSQLQGVYSNVVSIFCVRTTVAWAFLNKWTLQSFRSVRDWLFTHWQMRTIWRTFLGMRHHLPTSFQRWEMALGSVLLRMTFINWAYLPQGIRWE